MIAEIITVGTEILMGQILNSNAQFLAQKMDELGINLYYQSSVGDNLDRIVEVINLAQTRSDVILLCGGLGPTQDDLTKWALAKFLQVDMYSDQEAIKTLQEFFKKKNYTLTQNNLRQAEFPVGSTILKNTCGTAPGCFFQKNNKSYFIMPGPPHEIKAMYNISVKPILEKMQDNKRASRVVKIFGIGESLVEDKIQDLINNQTNPTIAPYAKLLEVSLRITSQTDLNTNPEDLLEPTILEIKKIFGSAIYSTHDKSLESVVASLLKTQNKTLSIAESLTGGLVCSKLVDIAGISQNLLEGIVCYSDDAKIRLGVAKQEIIDNSSVSEVVAKSMAENIRLRAGTDIGISTTGVAGPTQDANYNQVGLVYIGVSTKNLNYAIKLNLSGSRDRIRMAAALYALNQIRLILLELD